MAEEHEQPALPVNDDKNAPGLNLLSYFIPLIGAFLYLANKDEYPIKARGIGRSASMGFIYWVVFIVFKSLISSQ